MISWLNYVMDPLFKGFYINQVLVITGIFICGLLINHFLWSEDNNDLSLRLLLAFPSGLAAFIFIGVFTLTLGLPYQLLVLLVLFIVLIGAVLLWDIKKRGKSFKKNIFIKGFLVTIACVIVAIFASSGKTAMSVSNDSLYYFWQYPKAIVSYKGLRDQFDNFLTDTGLGASVIGTLPFLFGFGESFGIQEFFHINFVLFFGRVVFEEVSAVSDDIDNKKAVVISIMSSILLAVCTPVYILSHWAMANMYFMEYAFIAFFLGKKIAKSSAKDLIPSILLILYACSQLRMEGGVFVLLVIVMLSFLDIDTKPFAILLIGSAILQTIMAVRVFIVYTIDNPYLFMTAPKAAILIGAFLVLAFYLIFVKDKITVVIKNKLPLILILGLLFINILLCVLDSTTYIGNLKAFYGNLFGQSGWGMLPYLTIGSIIIILFWEIVLNRDYKLSLVRFSKINESSLAYWLCAMLGFFLLSLAVSFARGDVLDVNTGDSGNRVLLQIAPLVLISVIMYFVELITKRECPSALSKE